MESNKPDAVSPCGGNEDTSVPRENSLKWLDPPCFLSGDVVAGFGRGSKQLGIPTANFPENVVRALPNAFKTGQWKQASKDRHFRCRDDFYQIQMSVVCIRFNVFFVGVLQ